MLIEPSQGAALSSIQTALRDIATNLQNVQGTPGSYRERHAVYISWANSSVRRFRNLVTPKSVDRLVLTQRYWLLQSMTDQSDTKGVNELLNVEVSELVDKFEVALKELAEAIARWSRPGHYVVPDTSFYIHHPAKLEELELSVDLKVWEDPIHIVVPILVIDELDRLKETRDKHARWRSGYTLAVLDRLLPFPNSAAVLKPADFEPLKHGGFPTGEVTIEVLMDPPDHIRLPIPDDEITDRAMAVQAWVGKKVTVLTYDTGEAFRARQAGAGALKFTSESSIGP